MWTRVMSENSTYQHYPYGQTYVKNPAHHMDVLDEVKKAWITERDQDKRYGSK